MHDDGGTAPPVGTGRRSELGLRILSGIVLAAIALLATWHGGWPFALLWLAAALVIAAEWLAMTAVEPRRPLIAILALGLAALLGAVVAGASWPVDLAIAAATALAILAVARGGPGRAWTLAGFAYAAVAALVPLAMRGLPVFGLAAILWMFAVVWGSDIAGYFVGRRVGGPKLWPSVSPKKTWSGFLGGLAAATLAGPAVVFMVLGDRTASPVGWPAMAFGSAVASLASQMGDLAESALKRRFAIKDSGHLIPGHGGVMDRLDGFVAVAFVCGVALVCARLFSF